jgi:putative oxidoreductase
MAKVTVLALVIIAIAIEALYLTGNFGTVYGLWYNLYIIVLSATFALTRGNVRWVGTIVRVTLGVGFALTVLDRFGVFGPYGTKGVSWGDWSHFVAYTQQVNAFVPASWAPALASIANFAEIVLAIALILGIVTRLAAFGTFALLLLYAIAMTVSLGFQSQLAYGVIVICSSALYLALNDASFFSIEGLSRNALRHIKNEV